MQRANSAVAFASGGALNDPRFLSLFCVRVRVLFDPCTRALNREKLPKLSPPTECHLGEGFVSVIVPAYNEGDGIKLTLSTISQHAQVRV